MQRLRLAERTLASLAAAASYESKGEHKWVCLAPAERGAHLLRVQTVRCQHSRAEGGVTHAERRRMSNLEHLLYGERGVHLRQLTFLADHCQHLPERSARLLQTVWRVKIRLRKLRARAKARQERSPEGKHASGEHQQRRASSSQPKGRGQTQRPEMA